MTVADEQQVQRPPTSGPGSGVAAWREYAAAVTGSPAAAWQAMSREDIITQLAADGVEQPEPQEQPETVESPVVPVGRHQPPEWMVPTEHGMMPESQLRRRR